MTLDTNTARVLACVLQHFEHSRQSVTSATIAEETGLPIGKVRAIARAQEGAGNLTNASHHAGRTRWRPTASYLVQLLAQTRTAHRNAIDALRTLRMNVRTAAVLATERREVNEPGSLAGMMRNAPAVWPGMAMATVVLKCPEAQ